MYIFPYVLPFWPFCLVPHGCPSCLVNCQIITRDILVQSLQDCALPYRETFCKWFFLLFDFFAFCVSLCASSSFCALRIQGLYLLLLFLKQIKEDTMYVCYFIWPRPPHIHTLPNCVNRYVQLYVCLTKKNTKQNTTHMQYIRQRIHEHPLGWRRDEMIFISFLNRFTVK